MELFDVIKTIFKKKKDWEEVGKNDKVRNFFMIQRIMSIQFPIQANQFNHVKINPRPVVDWWHGTMSNHFSKTPPWIFTKTKKKEGKEEKKIDFSDFEETEKFIMKKFEVSKRELRELKQYYPEKYFSWVKELDSQIKSMHQEKEEK
jgi:hypothetical protein